MEPRLRIVRERAAAEDHQPVFQSSAVYSRARAADRFDAAPVSGERGNSSHFQRARVAHEPGGKRRSLPAAGAGDSAAGVRAWGARVRGLAKNASALLSEPRRSGEMA